MSDSDSDLAPIEAALRAGDRGQAIRLAQVALGRGRRHPLLFSLRAIQAEAAGRTADAVDDLRAASALAAEGEGEAANALGLLLARLGRGREAIASFEEAVRRAPAFAPGWRNLGMLQVGHGDVASARVSLGRAAAFAPEDAEPRGQLATLAARRGDWREAERWAREALRLDGDLPSATRALAEVDMRAGRYDQAERRLRAWLVAREREPTSRRMASGLLGEVLERQARYAEAFATFARSNRDTQARNVRFAGPGLLNSLENLQRQSADLPLRRPDPVDGSPCRHVFLMGFMRSGTTLIEQALAARDDVVTLEEQEALVSGVQAYLSPRHGIARLAAATEAELDVHRADYWARVKSFGVEPTGKVFVDKVPFNGVKLALIARLFPASRAVFSIRDPRDVLLSCFRHRFAVNAYTYQLLDLGNAARFYAAYLKTTTAFADRLAPPILSYRHEDLVDDFPSCLHAICGYLGLPWREEMRDVGRRVREGRVSSPSAVQLRDGLSRDGLQSWRRYAAQLVEIERTLQPWIDRFGYAGSQGWQPVQAAGRAWTLAKSVNASP